MARTPRCTKTRHRALVKQRARQSRYTKRHPGAAAKASASYYRSNRKDILKRRRKLNSPTHRKRVAAARAKYGGTSGRPRTC